MIAKMKSNTSSKETLEYNDKVNSEIIFVNQLTGNSRRDVEKQMTLRQKLFMGRAKNLTAHIIISPSIEDGRMLTRLEWKEIGNSFLQKAGLSNHQSIAYLHKDKDHFHLHIVVNRIDGLGKIYRNGNELVMSQRIGDEIAMERGLRRASEIRRERKLGGKKGLDTSNVGCVAQMRKDATEAATEAWKNGKFEQYVYFEKLQARGYEVQFFYKNEIGGCASSKLRGYSINRKKEHPINASQIGSEFTLRRLEQQLPSDALYTVSKKEIDNLSIDLQACFERVIKNHPHFEAQFFLDEIRLKGYRVREYFHKGTDTLRGYGIEVNNNVINSSEISPEFTLTNMRKRFETISNSINPILNAQRKARKEKRTNKQAPDTKMAEYPDSQMLNDLTRTIETSLLRLILKDLIRKQCYNSFESFFEAIEERGYHVHLRYENGSPSGYTVHKDTEHYQDREIDNGQFSLFRLIEQGVFHGMSLHQHKGLYFKFQKKQRKDHLPGIEPSPSFHN